MSKEGMRDAPATGKLGGVILTPTGVIRHSQMFHLLGTRHYGPNGPDGVAVRRYLLGLSLVMLTAPRDHDLRQGCLLVLREGEKPQWVRRYRDGRRDPIPLDHEAVLEYARDAAKAFGVGEDRLVQIVAERPNQAVQTRIGKNGKNGKA